MKYHKIIFLAFVVCAHVATVFAAPARCSKQSLTRCLDSACAINIGANPAARCQYCGTSDAGTPNSGKKAMKSVTAGKSSKNVLSDKELKNAPSDAGKRYMWASSECLKKLPDCTAEDISETYDKLIEQSCTAAGIAMKTTAASNAINQKPTKSKCQATFTKCMNTQCGTGFDNCSNDSEFDRAISLCATESNGCDEYMADLRSEINGARNQQFADHDNAIEGLVKAYQENRKKLVGSAVKSCQSNNGLNSCVKTVCETNMVGKCENENEKVMARSLCKFYETACGTIKNIKNIAESDETIADKTKQLKGRY